MKLPTVTVSKKWRLRLFLFLAGLVVGGFIGALPAIAVLVLVLVVIYVLPEAVAMGAKADPAKDKPKEKEDE
jgi:uncharacterized membrane protein